MGQVPSEDDYREAQGTITRYLNYPDDLWNRLPPEMAMRHTDEMEAARRKIQAYEENHGLPSSL